MRPTKYHIKLMVEERQLLEELVRKGVCAARSQTRARIMLLAAEGRSDEDIMAVLGISASMVYHTKQRCVEVGPEAALRDRPRPGARRKLTEKHAAHVIAIACSDAPLGHDHWTLRMLADEVVRLEMTGEYSHESIRRLLKKHPQTLATKRVVHSGSQR